MEKVKFTDYGYLKLALKTPDFTIQITGRAD